MAKKRGQLSLDEQQFIKNNIGQLTVEQIADQINRSVKPVERYIIENRLSFDKEENITDENLRLKLHAKTFWPEIIRQFDEDTGELEYFENTWIGLVK